MIVHMLKGVQLAKKENEVEAQSESIFHIKCGFMGIYNSFNFWWPQKRYLKRDFYARS